MKKITISLVALLAICTYSSAQTFPADGINSYKALYDSENLGMQYTGIPYLGVGYSYMNTDVDISTFVGDGYNIDIHGNAVTLLAGYEINNYFAIEGRYSKTVNDLYIDIGALGSDTGDKFGGSMSNLGLYLKPMYQSGRMGLYGLLGVGHVRFDIDNIGNSSENEFQWGLGMSFDAGKSFVGNSDVTFFVDYIRLNNDSYVNIGSTSFGLLFKF